MTYHYGSCSVNAATASAAAITVVDIKFKPIMLTTTTITALIERKTKKQQQTITTK